MLNEKNAAPSSAIPKVGGDPTHWGAAADDHQVMHLLSYILTQSQMFKLAINDSENFHSKDIIFRSRFSHRVPGGKRGEGSDVEL